MNEYKSVEWIGGANGYLRLLDQTRLPGECSYRDCLSVEQVWAAIKELAVRGAPAIGVAAAYGVVLGCQRPGDVPALAIHAATYLKSSRPTAVNLAWACDRMIRVGTSLDTLLAAADAIRDEDAAMCRSIGAAGATIIPDGAGVLTHCNTGGLATSEYGTALAVIRTAWERGNRLHVFADETRPLLQGARLTMWELQQCGIPATLICDSMAGLVMKQGKVKLAIVGADRIAANGDTANKVGTYSVAVLAKAHGIPFYVAAPSSTFDLSLADGDAIPIEERNPHEITAGSAPAGITAYNPAFDVTPAALIAGIVTERGVISPVNHANIHAMLTSSQGSAV